MREIRFTREDVGAKELFLSALASALQFPDYFGGNWDAVDECLNDFGVDNKDETVLFHVPVSGGDVVTQFVESLEFANRQFGRQVYKWDFE